MGENDVYSKLYFAKITVENDWGYHQEELWYGSDANNLAQMIMSVMESWYLPNKEKLGEEIRDFYENLAAANEKTEDEKPTRALSFKELSGDKFNSNGLRLNVDTTNNLMEIYMFVAGDAFEVFTEKGEKPEDFGSIKELVEYMDKTYDIDEQIMTGLKAPNESTLSAALYALDYKYQYSGRHFRQQK